MNNLPDEIENYILYFIDTCKSNDINSYNLVCKRWNAKLINNNCFKVKIFNRDICGFHNKKIIDFLKVCFYD